MSARNPVTTINIDSQEVESLSSNTTGQFSTIADITIPDGYRYEFPGSEPMQAFVYTHESKSVASNTTGTVSLSNDLVNSPSVRDIPTSSSESSVSGPFSLVVWDDNDDIQSGVNSVDYSGNSFDYDNTDGSTDNLEVYYLWKDSSQLQFRKYTADEEEYEVVWQGTVRQFHESRTFDSDSYITFDRQFSMSSKEHLKLVVKTDVDLTNWDVYDDNQGGGPGNLDTWSYSDFRIPVRKQPLK